MKKSIASVVAFSFAFNGTQALAYQPSEVAYAHACEVLWKDTGEVLPATCGVKADPMDNAVREYRTFDHDGLIYEQYRIQEPGREERIHQIVSRPDGSLAEESVPPSHTRGYEPNMVGKVLAIGGVVVTAGAALAGVRHLYRAGYKTKRPIPPRSRSSSRVRVRPVVSDPSTSGTDVAINPNSYLYDPGDTGVGATTTPEDVATSTSHGHSTVLSDAIIPSHESPVSGDWSGSDHGHTHHDHGSYDFDHGHHH